MPQSRVISTDRTAPRARRTGVRRAIVTAAFAATLVLAIAPAVFAQTGTQPGAQANASARRMIAGKRLLRTASGFIGIGQIGGATIISSYNDTLGDPHTVIYTNVTPLDLAPSDVPGQCLLLAIVNGEHVLNRLVVDSLSLTVIWHGTAEQPARIVGSGDLDHDGRPDILLAGPSGLYLIGADGRRVSGFAGRVIASTISGGDTSALFAVIRDAGTQSLVRIDARTDTIISSRDIGSGDRAWLFDRGRGARERLIAVTGDGSIVVTDRNLHMPEPPARFDGTPLGLVTADDGEGPTSFVVAATSGSVRAVRIDGRSTIRLDYPLSGIPVSAGDAGAWFFIAAADSLALYDRELQLLAVLPSVGNGDVTVTAIDARRLLVASSGASQVIAVPATQFGWLERNWMLLAAAILLAAIVVVVAALLRRYRFIRAIYNNLVRAPGSAGTIITSRSQRVRHLNQSARRLLEIDSYLPLGRHITDYLSADEFSAASAALRKLFADGIEFEERIDVLREGAARALALRGRPMTSRYGSTAGYLIIVEDITQTLERERLLNWASVAHHIAHEMKTPLGTVRMTAEMLRDRQMANGAEPETTRATQRIVKQSVRLREIVDDLLTVARTDALEKSPIDLGQVVTALVRDHQDNLPRNVDLRLELVGADFACMGDAPQLTVALRNLIDNGIQAIGTREGGLLRVQLAGDTKALTIIVEDNGVGMNPSTLAKLFQPFYTERQGGSGIGTVIIKRVIEGHGGTIRVASSRGKGTTFTISMPRA